MNKHEVFFLWQSMWTVMRGVVDRLLWAGTPGPNLRLIACQASCVIKRDQHMPLLAHLILTRQLLQVVHWNGKTVEHQLDLQHILHIQTVTDVPSFVVDGPKQEAAAGQMRVFVHVSKCQLMTTIELLFLQPRSRFPKCLQHVWLHRLMECATGGQMTSFTNQQVPLLDANYCYDYACRAMASKDNVHVLELSRKMCDWLSEVAHFDQLVWRDTVVIDWLMVQLKARSNHLVHDENVILQLLKCLNSMVDTVTIGGCDGQWLMSTVPSIVQDVLYNLTINGQDNRYLECCVDILFSLSLLSVDDWSNCSSSISSCVHVSTWIKLVKCVMNGCVGSLRLDQLHSSQVVITFKTLYTVGRLAAENAEIKRFVQSKYNEDFRYFGSPSQLSVKINMPSLFKQQFLIFLKRFEEILFNKTKF